MGRGTHKGHIPHVQRGERRRGERERPKKVDQPFLVFDSCTLRWQEMEDALQFLALLSYTLCSTLSLSCHLLPVSCLRRPLTGRVQRPTATRSLASGNSRAPRIFPRVLPVVRHESRCRVGVVVAGRGECGWCGGEWDGRGEFVSAVSALPRRVQRHRPEASTTPPSLLRALPLHSLPPPCMVGSIGVAGASDLSLSVGWSAGARDSSRRPPRQRRPSRTRRHDERYEHSRTRLPSRRTCTTEVCRRWMYGTCSVALLQR